MSNFTSYAALHYFYLSKILLKALLTASIWVTSVFFQPLLFMIGLAQLTSVAKVMGTEFNVLPF
jgi:hypothetical protein